jgi:hypothetical protein
MLFPLDGQSASRKMVLTVIIEVSTCIRTDELSAGQAFVCCKDLDHGIRLLAKKVLGFAQSYKVAGN